MSLACRAQNPEALKIAGKPVAVTVPLAAGLAASEHFELRFNRIQGAPRAAVILRVFAETPEAPAANRDTSVDDRRFLGHVTVLPTGDSKRSPVDTIISVPARRHIPSNATKLQITIVSMNDSEVQIGSIQASPAK